MTLISSRLATVDNVDAEELDDSEELRRRFRKRRRHLECFRTTAGPVGMILGFGVGDWKRRMMMVSRRGNVDVNRRSRGRRCAG
jgi:hypothetical protein